MNAVGPGTRLRAVDNGVQPAAHKALGEPLVVGRVYTCNEVIPDDDSGEAPCLIHTDCRTLVQLREIPVVFVRTDDCTYAIAYCLKSFRPADEDPSWLVELRKIAQQPLILDDGQVTTSPKELNPV